MALNAEGGQQPAVRFSDDGIEDSECWGAGGAVACQPGV